MENVSSQPGFDCWGGVVWLSLADCAFYPHLKLFNIELAVGRRAITLPSEEVTPPLLSVCHIAI